MNIISGLKKILTFIRRVSIIRFIKYNYLSKNVQREKGVYVIPYKGAVIDISGTAKLYLSGGSLEVGTNKLKGSKAETYIRMKAHSVWKCCKGGQIAYGATIEIHEKALLETDGFYINTSTVVVCTKHIIIGNDVWIGRDNVIYDSDYHQIQNERGEHLNKSKPVVIGSHVWLTNHILVMKGVSIGAGTVVAPYTVLRKNFDEKSMVVNGMAPIVVNDDVYWSSKRVPDWGYDKYND